jgi:hypothetical protein
MKQFLFTSAIVGSLLLSLPMYAQSTQTPNTNMPSGASPSGTTRTTTTDTMKRDSRDTNRQVINNLDTMNGRNLPYYKTHGRGGKYIGLRP